MTMAKRKYQKKPGVAVLKRPLYKAGLLLQDDDLTAAVEYTRNMSKLLFRSLFGCGVICGLEVTARLTCNGTRIDVTVAPGIALDCEGNPIHVPKAFTISYDADCEEVPDKIWVTICYLQQCCGPRDISCSVDDEGQRVKTRVIDGFEVRLYPGAQPGCACSCLPPPPAGTTPADPCCDDESAAETPTDTAEDEVTTDSVAVAVPPICPCFVDHWKGKCECDCDCCCNCVFIGMVNVELDGKEQPITDPRVNTDLFVDNKGVRWIRPMLVGYYKCDEYSLPAPPPQFQVNFTQQGPPLQRIQQQRPIPKRR